MEKRAINIRKVMELVANKVTDGLAGVVGHSSNFVEGAGRGVERFGRDVAESGVGTALKGSAGQPFAKGNLGSSLAAGYAAGRTAPVAIPAGVTLKHMIGNDKEAADQDMLSVLEGFIAKCAELGQDPEEMWKTAFEWGNASNYFGADPKSVPLVPEEEGISGSFQNLGRRMGAGWARLWHGQAGARDYAANLHRENALLQAGHRRNAAGSRWAAERANAMNINPETGGFELSPAYAEQQYRTANQPYWKERAKTQRARMQSMYGGGSGYSGMGSSGAAYMPPIAGI